MKKRILAILLCLSMVMNVMPSSIFATKLEEQRQQKQELQASQQFKDVKLGDWYYDSIMYAVENNIFAGTSPDTFAVNDPMTRGMYVTVLGRLAKMGEDYGAKESPFSDVKPSAYYAPSVIWATEKGIAKGIGDSKFGPNSPVTREQMAIFIVRFFEAYNITYPNIILKEAPIDLEKINDYAKDSVLKLWNTGLLGGDEKGNFNPKKNATRAEVASFVVRIDQTVLSLTKDNKPQEETKPKEEPKPKEESKPTEKIPPKDDNKGNSDEEAEAVKHYNIIFNTNGGSKIETKRIPGGTSIGDLPTPFKENTIFSGWYYDAGLGNRVQAKDAVKGDINLYAKYSDVAPLEELETPSFASALDQGKDFKVTVVSSEMMTNQEFKEGINCQNLSSQNETDSIEVTGDGIVFKISGKGGFEEGATYKLTLEDERLQFQGLQTTVRNYNFTIAKAEVFNLSLNQELVYIPFNEVSNITQDGEKVTTISRSSAGIGSDSETLLADLTKGTFEYAKKLQIGDIVTIYDGIRPDKRLLNDTRAGADGEITYLEITAASGDMYSYKNAELEDVLFRPDVLPFENASDLDGDSQNKSVTADESVVIYSEDIYTNMKLDSQTTVDVGDYLAFYNGEFSAHADITGYGCITSVKNQNGQVIISYTDATMDEILVAMDMYSKEAVKGETLLEETNVATLESNIEKQARDSGFADEAALYLADMALKTDSFTELSDDFALTDFQVLSEAGEPLDLDEIRLMAGKSKVGVELSTLKATISTKLQHFDVSGVRLTLDVGVKITIEVSDDVEIEIKIIGSFEEEVHLSINVDGGAKWKWWGIFPYIAEYEATANIDVYNFTGVGINATIVTKEKEDGKWTEDTGLQNISEELKKLLDDKDADLGKGTIADGLSDKYKAMIEQESDWVKLFEKEIFSTDIGIDPFRILVLKIAISFQVTANMNISLGCDFYYENAKRYIYTIQVFSKNVTKDVIDIREEHYEFTFYVMGTIGLRAGIKLEIALALISSKIASVGISAEVGVYIRVWGYFYYQLEYTASKGRSSSYSGALLFELGIYLEVVLEAQAFGGTFSKEVELYSEEWPLWSAGKRENVRDFAYIDTNEFVLKKFVRALAIPDELFNMSFMDLKTGDVKDKIFDDAKYFDIEITNKAFSYDANTNTLTIEPAVGKPVEVGQMIIRWGGAPLAFTSAPIIRTFDLYWDNLSNGYTIIFNANGGSVVPMILTPYNKPIEKPAAPTKMGYVFDDWYNSAAYTTKYVIPALMPNTDTVAYAKWIPNKDTKYTVEYYQQNANNSLYTIVESDTQILTGITDSIVKPAPKTYKGFSTPGLQELEVLPDGSAVVKYYYPRESYTVSFDPGEAGGELIVYKVKYGKPINPPQINRKGYTFKAWDKKVPEIMPNEDMSFSAQWNPSEDIPYRAEHYIQNTNGKGYALAQIEKKKGRTNQILKNNDFVIAGEGIFLEKSTVDGENAQTAQIKGDGNLIVKLYYTRNEHKVNFIVEKGTNTEKTYRYGEQIEQPIIPVKEGYTFSGWKTGKNLLEAFDFSKPMSDNEMTIYGALIPKEDIKFVVEHYYQDTTGAGYRLNKIDEKKGTTDEQLKGLDFALKLDGILFEKATVDGKITETAQVRGDGSLVLKLYYTRNTYTMTLKIKDGETTEKIYRFGESTVLPTPTSKNGYTFSGWNSDEALLKGFEFGKPMLATDITLYGAFIPNGDTKFSIEHYYQNTTGDKYTLKQVDKKAGTTDEKLNLLGFELKGQGMVFEKATVDGEIANSTQLKGDGSLVIKLYYTRNQYTMTLKVTNGETTQRTYRFGENTVLPTISIKDGYTFSGWKINEGLTEEFTFGKSMPASDMTIYGALTPNHDTKFSVEHYYQNTTDDKYTRTQIDKKTGMTDKNLTVLDFTLKSEGIAFEKAIVDGRMAENAQIKGDGSLVIKLYYTRNEYTMILKVTNGETTQKTYRFGENIILPITTAKDGYKFSGWKDNEELTEAFNLAVMPSKNIMVYAKNSPNSDTKYRAEHYQQNLAGKDYTLVVVDYLEGITDSETIAIPKTYTGFVTKGVRQERITGDGTTVIRIEYDRGIYNVALDLAGGKINGGDVMKYTYGVGAQLPTDITRAGYIFNGWFDGESHVAYISTSEAGDKNYVAKWSPITNTVYTVKHLREDLDGNYSIQEIEKKYGTTDTETVISSKDYLGFTAGIVKQENIAGDGKTEIEILYSRNSYTLSWQLVGGSLSGDYTEGSVKFGELIKQPDVGKDGYKFSGWYRDLSLQEDIVIPNVMPAEDISVFGQLTAKSDIGYKVIHYIQNADGEGYASKDVENLTGDMDLEVTATQKLYDYCYLNQEVEGTLLTDKIKADGSLILKLYYDRQTFTVNYEVEGQPYGEQATYKYGETIVYPDMPEKEGYFFDQWQLNGIDFLGSMSGENITLTPGWSAGEKSYTARYYLENLVYTSESNRWELIPEDSRIKNGTFGDQITISPEQDYVGFSTPEGQEVTINSHLSTVNFYYPRNAYGLLWNLSGGIPTNDYTQSGSVKFRTPLIAPTLTMRGNSYTWDKEIEKTMIDKDLEYTANWTEDSYTVKFNEESLGSITVTYGATYGELPEPSKEGFIFNGWYADTAYAEKIESEMQVTIPKDHVLYASWTVNTYNLDWVLDGGNVADNDYTNGKTPYGTAIKVPALTKIGYVFKDWGIPVEETMPAKDLSYVATWTPQVYTIYFDGLALESKSVTYAETYGELPIPNKVGHTFDGWFTSANDGEKVNANTNVTITTDQVLYAHWTAESYTLVWNLDDGIADKDYISGSVKYGTTIKQPVPTKTGYNFKGWDTTVVATMPAENLTYTATWEIIKSTVSFDGVVGEESSKTVTYGETYGELPVPEKVGYQFDGWFTQPSAGEKVEPSTLVTIIVDQRLHAHWIAESYTLTWDLDEGVDEANYTKGTVAYGTIITKPDPIKVGYEFIAWDHEVESTMPAENLIYKATWEPKTYTISFDAIAIASISVTYDQTYGVLPIPTKEGHKFDGWFTKSNDGVMISEDTLVSIMADQRLYAQWTAKDYTLTWDLDEGVATNTNDYTKGIVKYETNIIVPIVTKEGYDFVGWNPEVNHTAMPDEDLAYKAKWEVKTYTVTLIPNGGTINNGNITAYTYGISSDLPTDVTQRGYTFNGWYEGEIKISTIVEKSLGNKTYTAKWSLNSYDIIYHNMDGATNHENNVASYTFGNGVVLGTPTKVGYDFKGWYKDETLITSINTILDSEIGAINLYAKWGEKVYNVTLNTDDGILAAENDIKSYTYGKVKLLPTSEKITKAGYIFKGWSDGTGVVTEIPLESMGDKSYTATWSLVPYAISYELNGGENSEDNPDSYNVSAGDINLAAPIKANNTFGGWFADKDFVMPVGSPAIKSGTTQNVTFYAKWNLNSYTVAFQANGGTGTMSPQNFNVEESKALSPNEFSREGYNFAGWATSYNGAKAYDQAATVSNLTLINEGTVTLYALWTRIDYTITYILNGGSNGLNPQKYTVETLEIKLANPTRDGYSFQGWYDNPGFTGNKVLQIAAGSTGNLNLYASWKLKGTVGGINSAAQTVTYDGTNKVFAISGTDLKDLKVEYKKEWESTWSSQAINAGLYQVRITRATDDAYNAYELVIDKALQITRASRTMSPPTGGTAYNSTILVTPITADHVYGHGDIEYAAGQTTSGPTSAWSTSLSIGNLYALGDYYLFAKVSEGGNFLGTSSVASIAKVKVTNPLTSINRNWKVRTKTGTDYGAGTGADVGVRFNYHDSGYGGRHIMDIPSYNDHENGADDEYPITETKDPWMLSGFEIGNNGSGAGSDWQCRHVELTIGSFGPKRINVDRWFNGAYQTYATNAFKREITSVGEFNAWGGSYTINSGSTGSIAYSFNGNITDQYGTYNAYAHADAPVIDVQTSQAGYTDCFSYNRNSFTVDKAKLYKKMIENNLGQLNFTINMKFNSRSTNNTTFTKTVTITR